MFCCKVLRLYCRPKVVSMCYHGKGIAVHSYNCKVTDWKRLSVSHSGSMVMMSAQYTYTGALCIYWFTTPIYNSISWNFGLWRTGGLLQCYCYWLWSYSCTKQWVALLTQTLLRINLPKEVSTVLWRRRDLTLFVFGASLFLLFSAEENYLNYYCTKTQRLNS